MFGACSSTNDGGGGTTACVCCAVEERAAGPITVESAPALAASIAGQGESVPEGATWVVLYHIAPKEQAFKGRGEFLKLMFEDASVPYFVTNEHCYGPVGWMDMFRHPEKKGTGVEVKPDTSPFPLMYPPAVWHRPPKGDEVLVNQGLACMAYVGSQLGYKPHSDAERARADCIAGNCMDYLARGRASFHPLDEGASFHVQAEEGRRASKLFSEGPMRVWLQHFEKVLRRVNGAPVAGGKLLTHADFALFHVLDATQAQFNSDFYDNAWDREMVPSCKAFLEKMARRPNLKAYFASDRRLPWSGDSMM